MKNSLQQDWLPTSELRFVRRPVRFAGHAEPAFRLVLQQLWRCHPVRDGTLLTWEEWRDIPTVAEPPEPAKESWDAEMKANPDIGW
jgi:hypothetical protein